MARVILEQPGEDVIVGGRFNGFGDDTDTTVIGTTSGGEVIDVRSPADVVLDASFNQGGDVIRLPGEADDYTARLEGSRVILTSTVNQVRISIPVGENPNTIIFGGDDARRIEIENGQVFIGDEVIDGTERFLDSLDATQLSNALFALQQAEENLQDFLDDNNVDSAADADAEADQCEAELAAARANQTDSQLVAEVNEEQADVEAARRDADDAERDIDSVAGLRAAIAAEEAAEQRVRDEEQDVRDAEDRVDEEQADVDAARARTAREEQQVQNAQDRVDAAQTEFDAAQIQLDDAQTEFNQARDALAAEQQQTTDAQARVDNARDAVNREIDDVSAAFENFEAQNPPAELRLLDDELTTIPNENNEVLIDRDGAGPLPEELFIIRNPITGELEFANPADAALLGAEAVLIQVNQLDAAEEERQAAETALINQQEEQTAAQERFDQAVTDLAIAQDRFDDAQTELDAANANLDTQQDQLDAARANEAQQERELEVAQANLIIQRNELEDARADLQDARDRTNALDPGGELRGNVDEANARLAQEEAELRAAIEALEERRDMIDECEDARAIANEAARLEGIRDDRADDVGDLGFENVEIVDGDNGVAPRPPEGTQEDEEATAGDDAFVFTNDEDVNEFFVINNFGDQGDDVLFIGGQEFTLVRIGENVEVGDDDVGDDTRMEIFVQQQGDDVVLFIEDDPFDGNANSGGFTGDIIVLTDNLAGDVNFTQGFITVDDNIFGTQNANFA